MGKESTYWFAFELQSSYMVARIFGGFQALGSRELGWRKEGKKIKRKCLYRGGKRDWIDNIGFSNFG
jgi:hypothetical protein